MSVKQSVVISGIGIVAPDSADLDATSAASMPEFNAWPESEHPPSATSTIANVKKPPKDLYFTRRQQRLMDRAMILLSCASGQALTDAGYAIEGEENDVPDDTMTFFGTSRAEQPSAYKFTAPILKDGNRRLNGADFPMIARNVACGQVAIRFGLRGYSSMLASGQIASLEALSRAHGLIAAGRASIALVGGIEVLSKISLFFARQHYCKQSMQASRPYFFGSQPGYLMPSEGSCVLVLESAEHARQRGATAYAQIDGWYAGRFGKSPHQETLMQSWQHSMASAGCESHQIGLISAASGGSNRHHEKVEAEALTHFLSDPRHPAKISLARSLVGEGESWSSALQVALAAQALHKRKVAKHWNLDDQAPDILRERSAGGELTGDCALVTGLDSGGSYCSLVLGAAESL